MIEKKCNALAGVIELLRAFYQKADGDEKRYLETMIGAAIWYLPKPVDAWSGFVSEGVLNSFHPESQIARPKFSEEHVFPRKVVARLLLESEFIDRNNFIKMYNEKYGRLHYITPTENSLVRRFQKVGVFSSPEEAYAQAKISLIKTDKDTLALIKRRNKEVIEKLLNFYCANNSIQSKRHE